jgi:hypothetical protein
MHVNSTWMPADRGGVLFRLGDLPSKFGFGERPLKKNSPMRANESGQIGRRDGYTGFGEEMQAAEGAGAGGRSIRGGWDEAASLVGSPRRGGTVNVGGRGGGEDSPMRRRGSAPTTPVGRSRLELL